MTFVTFNVIFCLTLGALLSACDFLRFCVIYFCNYMRFFHKVCNIFPSELPLGHTNKAE